jgi:hypothetical protein
MTSDVGMVANAVAKVAELVAEFQKTSQVRQMKAAIEAGEKYIQTNKDTSLPDVKKEKLLKHYEKRFFHYN